MRFRKPRLTTPMVALNANNTANCQGRSVWPRQSAESRKDTKLATFTKAASRARYLPRTASGTSEEIHGSQAALEMPRERLKPKSSVSMRTRRVLASRKPPATGTSAIMKIKLTAAPSSKDKAPVAYAVHIVRGRNLKITSSGIMPAMIPRTVALAPSDFA